MEYGETMKYLLITLNNEQWWIELNNDNCAVRQIVLDHFGIIHMSCFEDCLAEEPIDFADLEGAITIITKEKFQSFWYSLINNHIEKWNETKKKYPLNCYIFGVCRYFYPQGIIITGCDYIALYIGEQKIKIHQSITTKVIKYDDLNMWLICN